MLNNWQRPETSPYPRIYSRFKGKRPMPDGRVPEFWVQDATPDMADAIADHMETYFARDEAMAKALDFRAGMSAAAAEAGKQNLRSVVLKRLSVVAMTEWPRGEPQLAGVNLLYHFRRGDEKFMPEVPDENLKKMQQVMFLTLNMVDVYAKFGVEEFTTAVGLSVHPDFRGQGLGVALLEARAQMTRAVGLRLTLNNFTGVASQKAAERAGYQLLAEVRYADIKDEDGREWFPGIDADTLQFRAKYVGDDDDGGQADAKSDTRG